MMYRYFILYIVFCCVTCDGCVTVDFENDFEENFISDYGICLKQASWDIKRYASVNISSPHPSSTSFIAPTATVSCISSFNFTMTAGGTLEVNLYSMAISPFDQFIVGIFRSDEVADTLIYRYNHFLNTIPAWNTVIINIEKEDSFDGYITFQSIRVSPNSILWIDSFRYYDVSSYNDSCVIYEEMSTTETSIRSTTDIPEDCVTSNFEYNFEDNFTYNNSICAGLSPWSVKQYSSVNVQSPHPSSSSFITPQGGSSTNTTTSCVSSFKFLMTAGGTLEVNVYTMPVSLFDQLTVRVFEYSDEGTDSLVDTVFHTSNSVPQWETIRITIKGKGSFEGYLVFQTWTISINPIIWIDSFRYIGPTADKSLCTIYEEASTTVTTIEAPIDYCVTANFEDSFEDQFTNSYGVCDGFDAWDIKQYSSDNIESPHPYSTRFIKPQGRMSCVSSFKFVISSGGTLEVNVYSIASSFFDQLTIGIFQSAIDGQDIPISSTTHNPNTTAVWETISMKIAGYGSFEGYVTFQAWSLSDNPIIWIDSFRYIAPSFDKELCVIYGDSTLTTELTTITTTITTTSEVTSPIVTDEGCLTVDFESNFEDYFISNHGVCAGTATWNIKKYSAVDIDSPHSNSASFIASRVDSSCVSSFTFTMAGGGVLEVNSFMNSSSLVDQLMVIVYQLDTEGDDVVINRAFRNNMNPDFVPGWQKLNLRIDVPEKFEGYVTFQSLTMSPNPVIWIDSFRYIGPSSDAESCLIYADDYND